MTKGVYDELMAAEFEKLRQRLLAMPSLPVFRLLKFGEPRPGRWNLRYQPLCPTDNHDPGDEDPCR